MDQQKKQKVMIGALAVCALGAGTFWWINSSGGAGDQAAMEVGPVEHRERTTTNESGPKESKKREVKTRTASAPAAAPEKRTREEQPEEKVNRRERANSGEKKEKKTKLAPAA